MIPASPAVMAPPVKKQRAGNTPEDPIATRTQNAISYRSERLQDLAQRYGTAVRVQQPTTKVNGNGPPNHNSSASINGRGPPPVRPIGNTVGPPTTIDPPSVSFNLQQSSTAPTLNSFQNTVPPPKPGMASIQPRRSDIFPTAPKSPISAKPPNASVTSATLQSTQPLLHGGEGAVARRLEDSFQVNGTTSPSTFAMGAPPVRPPPPPGPPPLVKEDSAKKLKEEPTKSVTFQVPNSSSAPTMSNNHNLEPIPQNGVSPVNGFEKNLPGVSTPGVSTLLTKDAGNTPFYTALPPGATPFRSNATEGSSSPSTTTRRELLRNMREFAESPDKELTSPNGSIDSVKTPELRLHEQLASAEKDKATALRKVAQLENEISQLKNKSIGFSSPVANILPSPVEKRSRRVGTPHPKANLPKPSTPTDIEAERRFLLEATKKAPFEYDSDDGVTFIVRRPYGLASETDLWYKVGQLPSKLYAKSANVESFATIEVAATITCDNSIFLLFGDGDVRHQSNVTGISTDYGNVEDRPTALGNVTYVDQNAIDKEYSLHDLYEYALSVRGHYCTTVRSFAAALQLYPEQITPIATPNASKVVASDVTPRFVETAEKAVATEEDIKDKVAVVQDETTNDKKSQMPPPADDETSDVLGSFIQLFFSVIFGTLWFIIVTLPWRILTSTVVMAASVVLLSYIWLYLADGGNPTNGMHFNKPGIA